MEKEKWWENHKNARIHTLIDHLVALNHVTNDRRYKSTEMRRLSLVSQRMKHPSKRYAIVFFLFIIVIISLFILFE